jgi:hypothetical protein
MNAILKILNKPRALAMWDHTWLLRHYPGGDFESFECALDSLVERGYNAVRIEAFPHLIAADPAGEVQDEFFFAISAYQHVLWGNEWSVSVNPRRSLISFLKACRERDILVALSGWLPDESLRDLPHDPDKHNPNVFNAHAHDRIKRTDRFEGAQGLIHIWDQTLQLISDSGFLDSILYCDILNEYPCCHGYAWLNNRLKLINEPRIPGKDYNGRQVEYFNQFMQEVIIGLRAKWPQVGLTASLTRVDHIPWREVQLDGFDALDIHLWFSSNKAFRLATGSQSGPGLTANIDRDMATQYQNIKNFWQENKADMLQWMENEVSHVAQTGKAHNLAIGNTEGWGSVCWYEHPSLDWKWIQECAEYGAVLGQKYGYLFNCTTNFTHPHFRRLWRDIQWHQHVTGIIKTAKISPFNHELQNT